MPKNSHYVIHLPLLVLAVILLAGSYSVANTVTQDTQQSVLGKNESKENNSANKSAKPEKPVTIVKGQNAELHRQNIKVVVENLDTVATTEEEVGNEEASTELDEAVEETQDTAEETADAIEAVESKPKWQALLFGTDFKNLGQLRSQIVRNQNTIRKITSTAEMVVLDGNEEVVSEQLQTLLQEQQRLVAIIQENESQFSILGWVSKLLAGYTETPLDDDDASESSESTDTQDLGL